jgi:hypothetical protein
MPAAHGFLGFECNPALNHAAGCDLDTKIDKIGSPHTLVCVKNQASYKRRVVQRTEDLDNIKRLTE